MTQRVPCPQCGAQILQETAAKNNGLCMPCKGGYRKRIEQGIKHREREREYEQSAERKYWIALINRIFKSPHGFADLSHQEQIYYAVSCLIGEVHNGGFDQFFSNSSGELYGAALAGLLELGAEQTAGLLVQAKEALFGDMPVPIDRSQRLSMMPTMGNESHTVWKRLDSLDKAFYKDPDQLTVKCTSYAISHNLYTFS